MKRLAAVGGVALLLPVLAWRAVGADTQTAPTPCDSTTTTTLADPAVTPSTQECMPVEAAAPVPLTRPTAPPHPTPPVDSTTPPLPTDPPTTVPPPAEPPPDTAPPPAEPPPDTAPPPTRRAAARRAASG